MKTYPATNILWMFFYGHLCAWAAILALCYFLTQDINIMIKSINGDNISMCFFFALPLTPVFMIFMLPVWMNPKEIKPIE